MRILFLCAVLAFPPSAAIAADVTLENTAPPTATDQPVFTWSGAYFGLHAGGGWTNGEFSGLGITGYEDANGGVLGAFAGYNYPLGNSVVAGFEGDIEHHWNEQNVFGADFGTDWAGSLRSRLGYAFEHALVYAMAGWAGTRGYVDVPGLGKEKKTFSGYTIGAGLDYAFTDKMFGRIEYRYSDYRDKDLQGINVDVAQHAVRVGFGIQF